MVQILISSIAIVICLLCVLGIHELGHALAAKCFGVKINRISLGFGKIIFSFKRPSGYSVDIKMWPIGGCVHLLNNRVAPVAENQLRYCFDKKPIWVRTVILLSGSIANFIMAFLALVFMFMLGFKQLPSIIESVTPKSNAAISGLKSFDRITEVAGQRTPYWRDVGMQFIMHVGQNSVPVTACSKECQKISLNLDLWSGNKKDFSMFQALGIRPRSGEQNTIFIDGLSFLGAVTKSFSELLTLVCFFFVMIKKVITASIPFASLLGPFKFFEAVIDSFMQGVAIFLYFIGNFSLAMGIANLLPIPALDGGSIIYGLIEKVRGKPMSIALEVLIYRLISIAFAIFLVKLMVNDLEYYF